MARADLYLGVGSVTTQSPTLAQTFLHSVALPATQSVRRLVYGLELQELVTPQLGLETVIGITVPMKHDIQMTVDSVIDGLPVARQHQPHGGLGLALEDGLDVG